MIYNFSAGPSMLPKKVLKQIKQELFNWQNTGSSVMELSHRLVEFEGLVYSLQEKLRVIMKIPGNYKILFVPGGAQGQFDLIPMNLTKNNLAADYLVTGVWSQRAANFAQKYAKVNIATNSFETIMPNDTWQLNPKAGYVFYCDNETISGLQFATIPDVGQVPLVADLTSSILSKEYDVSKFGLIFASAQKNLGISGVTLVIIRDDLFDQALDTTPTIYNYSLLAKHNSIINTPPVFAIYVMNLMIDWLIDLGGLDYIAYLNHTKSSKLYNYIDNSNFYKNTIEKQFRSITNVTFDIKNKNLIAQFLIDAASYDLKYLKGHKLSTSLRASLYNAMPEAGVDKLIKFMQKFAKNC